jgi:hypothetical protein
MMTLKATNTDELVDLPKHKNNSFFNNPDQMETEQADEQASSPEEQNGKTDKMLLQLQIAVNFQIPYNVNGKTDQKWKA